MLVAALRDAGFEDVHAELLDAPLQLASAAECVRFERESFALLAPDDGRPRSRRAADARGPRSRSELGAFEGPHGFAGPCALVVAVGTRPLRR